MVGAAKLFASLGEPARLVLLKSLLGGEKTVGQLAKETRMKQGNVSKHLGLLLDVGLLGRRREGNFAYYFVGDPLVRQLCELVCDKVARDARERIGVEGHF